MQNAGSDQPDLLAALETVIAPLVEADGGELYLLPSLATGASNGLAGPIRLHLAGRFAGCPGNNLVSEHIIRPALEPVTADRSIEISSGRLVPPGAERIFPK